MNRHPLLRKQKCIVFGISRPFLRTNNYIDFGVWQKCSFIRTHKYTDFGISQKCPLLPLADLDHFGFLKGSRFSLGDRPDIAYIKLFVNFYTINNSSGRHLFDFYF